MDRRVLWAIALMMVIAIAPTFFFKQPPKRPVPSTVADSGARPSAGRPDSLPGMVDRPGLPVTVQSPAQPADTVVVSSPLYHYAIATRGGAIIQASLERYKNLAPGHRGETLRMLP